MEMVRQNLLTIERWRKENVAVGEGGEELCCLLQSPFVSPFHFFFSFFLFHSLEFFSFLFHLISVMAGVKSIPFKFLFSFFFFFFFSFYFSLRDDESPHLSRLLSPSLCIQSTPLISW